VTARKNPKAHDYRLVLLYLIESLPRPRFFRVSGADGVTNAAGSGPVDVTHPVPMGFLSSASRSGRLKKLELTSRTHVHAKVGARAAKTMGTWTDSERSPTAAYTSHGIPLGPVGSAPSHEHTVGPIFNRSPVKVDAVVARTDVMNPWTVDLTKY
jgi:hypothetical protein